jgi:hypothetical protein
MNLPRLLSPAIALALLAMPQIVCAAANGPAKKAAPARHVVPFIADDLDRARAEAKRTNRPIFVESWAPW